MSPGRTVTDPSRRWQYWVPPVLVADDDAVAAFAPRDVGGAGVAHQHVGHAVADARHLAPGGGAHGNAAGHVGERGDPEIGAIVTVVAKRAAEIVLRRGAGVVVEILLDVAILPERAVDRQLQVERPRRDGRGEGWKRGEEGGLPPHRP
jgi:hypothetical protein